MYQWSRTGPKTTKTTRSTASPRQPNRRAIRQVMRKTNAQRAESIHSSVRKYGFPGDRHVPPPHLLTKGDDPQPHYTDGCPAGQGTRDAPRRRAREESDNDQEGQVQEVK